MNMSVHKCVHCGEDVDDGNNRTCKKNCTEIMLFGVQIGVSSEDGHGAAAKSLSIRKSKSLDNIVQSCNPAAAAAESSGYLIRKSKSLNDVQTCNPDYTAAAESSGYLSDSKSHERKRGKPWSEEEHRSFLEGLEKLGKGDWKGIATKFVTSRKSSQVASHAQKYFNRINLTVSNKKRRRASVFDISPTHIAKKQPPQGSKSNKAEQSVHIASTASKNVGEFNVRPSTPAHVTTTEKPPLSPSKPSGIPEFRSLICQPRVSSSTKGYLTQTVMASVSWFPVMNFSNQNGVLVPSIRGNFAAVVPTSVDLNTWRHRWFEAGSAPSTTNNEELSLHIRNLALQCYCLFLNF